MEEIVRDLVALGMKEYEARVYAALVGIGEGTARDVHIASGVPRPRVYDVLESLARQNFAEVRQGTPLRYRPAEPGVVTARLRGEVDRAADRALGALDALALETRQSPAPVWYLDGEWSIRHRLEALVRGDDADLTIVCMREGGPTEYIPLLAEAAEKRSVDVVVRAGTPIPPETGKVRIVTAETFCPFFQEKIYGKVFSRPVDQEGSVFALEYILMAGDEESMIIYTENGRRKAVVITLPFITSVQHLFVRRMIAGGAGDPKVFIEKEGVFPSVKTLITRTVMETPVEKNPHGVDARKIYDTEHATMVHITLQPGESLKKHITPVDVAFYVLEGNGIVEIGEERRECGPDTLIESPARIPHRWINESDRPFRVLVVKVPRPTESTRLL